MIYFFSAPLFSSICPPSLLHSSAAAPPATATRPPATAQSGVNIPAPAAFVAVVLAVVEVPVLLLVLALVELAVLLWVLEEDVEAVCFMSGVSSCSKELTVLVFDGWGGGEGMLATYMMMQTRLLRSRRRRRVRCSYCRYRRCRWNRRVIGGRRRRRGRGR